MNIVLETVEWFRDTPAGMTYRGCDLCEESVCEDIWAGKGSEQHRHFYRVHPDQIIVCENCLEAYLRDAAALLIPNG